MIQLLEMPALHVDLYPLEEIKIQIMDLHQDLWFWDRKQAISLYQYETAYGHIFFMRESFAQSTYSFCRFLGLVNEMKICILLKADE